MSVEEMICSLLQKTRPKNTRFRTFPFSVSQGRKVQVLPQNDKRNYLAIAAIGSPIIGSMTLTARFYMLFRDVGYTESTITNNDVNTGFPIAPAITPLYNTGGFDNFLYEYNFQFGVAPIDAISLVNFYQGNATPVAGVLIEGSDE